VYLPERPVTRERIRDDIAGMYRRHGRCVVAISEGLADAGDPQKRTFAEVIAEGLDLERDTHGNVQLSGSGALGDWFAGYLKKELGSKLRLRADTFGYLQRSFPGLVSATDAAEARECGRKAVEYAVNSGVSGGSVVMLREPGEYRISYDHTELRNVAKETRHLPDEFINAEGNGVTQAFLDYARPLAGALPVKGRLLGMRK
jgi:6-phosphofructokinase 1